MKSSRSPKRWDDGRVSKLLVHYETQTEDEMKWSPKAKQYRSTRADFTEVSSAVAGEPGQTNLRLNVTIPRGINPYAKSLFIFLLSLFVASCTRITTEDLREQQANSDRFSVDQDYQSVYHQILTVGRECHERYVWGLYPVPDRVTVEGHLNREFRTANVTVVLHAGVIKNVTTISLMTVDISAIDEDNTKVTVYASSSWDSRPVRAVRKWVLRDSRECGGKDT